MKSHSIGNLEVHLTEPVAKPVSWIGRRDLIEQLLAAWTLVTDDDLPLCPRILGHPGMGKTTLAQAAASELGMPAYIYQCTMDTRPEDLLITPVLSEAGRITYQASALVSAMIAGGVAILDEANRMSEKSWASLAPLLDNRRYVESIVAGVRIESHPDFRCCVTMNDDASTYEVPEYILSRVQPMIEVDYPTRRDEMAVLRYNVAFAPENLLKMTSEFLEAAHGHRLAYSTRDGVHIMRYALKLMNRSIEKTIPSAFHRAVTAILGQDAEDFETRARGQFLKDNLNPLEELLRAYRDDDDMDDDDDEEEEEEDHGGGGEDDDWPSESGR